MPLRNSKSVKYITRKMYRLLLYKAETLKFYNRVIDKIYYGRWENASGLEIESQLYRRDGGWASS